LVLRLPAEVSAANFLPAPEKGRATQRDSHLVSRMPQEATHLARAKMSMLGWGNSLALKKPAQVKQISQ